MLINGKRKIILAILAGLAGIFCIGLTIGLAWVSAETLNIENDEIFDSYKQSLPTQILDRNGNLITEFFMQKREEISVNDLPKHVIEAVITREDKNFYDHNGISFFHLTRAFVNNLLGLYFSGASTITQQLAGGIYTNRTDITYTRKIIELWWAFQMERRYSKNEILELYLNKNDFGDGYYGIEAASQGLLGHTASELTLAEAVMLIIQVSNPTYYSYIDHPNNVKNVQYPILTQMVDEGYATQEEIDTSYTDFWNNYDWSVDQTKTAHTENIDKAPWFSEYVRREMEDIMYGPADIYNDGYIVHTTLDLNYQRIADRTFLDGLNSINASFQYNASLRTEYADEDIVPIIDMMSLMFDIPEFHVQGAKNRQNARTYYYENLNSTIDMLSMVFGIDELKSAARYSYNKAERNVFESNVEGAMITLENNTGYILSLIGGSEYGTNNEFIRAVQGQMQPGSSIKPLYYAEAIDSGQYTTTSTFHDKPRYFTNSDGSLYTPNNYGGKWYGDILLRYALAHSLNIPALTLLESIGFDAAISTMAKLTGISGDYEIAQTFERKYSIGLGVSSLTPLSMARAYATFANQGVAVEPLAIRYIEDRNGNIVENIEGDLRSAQQQSDNQVISPQAAYIMTNLLETTVESGTLSYANRVVGGFSIPMAGKTGTTNNWADGWAIGYSPYMTTAVWYGFDQVGRSLGVYQSGAISAGPVWAKYMKAVHETLPYADFIRPETGLVSMTVDADTGQLPTASTKDNTIEEIFIEGTEPRTSSSSQANRTSLRDEMINRLMNSMVTEDLYLPDFDYLEADILDNENNNDPFGNVDFDFINEDSDASTGKPPLLNPILD